MLHRFGPLNLEGGERRLNVAITRARRRMTVVSSFTAADLDPARLKARGALMLRDFLAYAASGGNAPGDEDTRAPSELAASSTTGAGPDGGQRGGARRGRAVGGRCDGIAGRGGCTDRGGCDPGSRDRGARHREARGRDRGGVGHGDPIVADFARRLRADGLIVHQDHGSSAHRLDLAVEDPRHPHRMLLAVETDGPGYAAMPSTRDRDRLRIEQLQRLGWQHVRVWTTDLFRDPAQDVSRVVGLVRAASDERSGVRRPSGGGPGRPRRLRRRTVVLGWDGQGGRGRRDVGHGRDAGGRHDRKAGS